MFRQLEAPCKKAGHVEAWQRATEDLTPEQLAAMRQFVQDTARGAVHTARALNEQCDEAHLLRLVECTASGALRQWLESAVDQRARDEAAALRVFKNPPVRAARAEEELGVDVLPFPQPPAPQQQQQQQQQDAVEQAVQAIGKAGWQPQLPATLVPAAAAVAAAVAQGATSDQDDGASDVPEQEVDAARHFRDACMLVRSTPTRCAIIRT
jgi:hypothetical protein